jgi:DNA-binding transcriptional regulator YhcF (GntR family)
MSRVISATRVATLVGDFPRSPAYLGLAEALRVLVGDGRLPLGAKLPSERELTGVLDVSRTTVTRAYEVLREGGYAEARRGAGTFTRVPGGRRRAHDRSLLPSAGGEDVIDLNCAAHSAPPGLVERPSSSPPTCPVPATSRWASRSCRRGSRRRTTPAGCRPSRSRSW